MITAQTVAIGFMLLMCIIPLAMGVLMVMMIREALKDRSWGFVIIGIMMAVVCLMVAVTAPMAIYLLVTR